MSQPTSFHAFHPEREREQREAEVRYQNAASAIWRDPDELHGAILEGPGPELAAIALLSMSDSAEAGDRMRVYTRNAVHERARHVGNCTEEIPPASEWNFQTDRVSALARKFMGIPDEPADVRARKAGVGA